MCDGTYAYPVKGSAPIYLDNPVIIICGNASIDTVYPNAAKFIKARFNQVRVDDAFRVMKINSMAPQDWARKNAGRFSIARSRPTSEGILR